ncbi:MAG: hypothetical protein M3295_00035, partial [Chloroflexota bacterium]|nr:hypothetical protein [Chloroflexota bacterium]
NGRVAYACEACTEAPETLVSVDIYSGDVRHVVDGGYAPHWSPDGTRLALFAWQSGPGDEDWGNLLVDQDGTDPVDLGPAYQARWSPDATRLAFVTLESELVVADLNGNRQVIHSAAAMSGEIAWSPDGARIAFVKCPTCVPDEPIIDPPAAIFTINVDGTGVRQVSDVGVPRLLAWSPDGTQLAFVNVDLSTGEMDVTALDLSTGTLTVVDRVRTAGDPWQDTPWSPDGTRFVFADGSKIRVVDEFQTASEATTIAETEGDLEPGNPQFAPDGNWILFTVWHRNAPTSDAAIWAARADGSGEPIPLEPDGGPFADWQVELVAPD